LRPHVHEFLEKVKCLTKLSYWTASDQNFQQYVLEETHLDQLTEKIHYYDSCTITDDVIYKSITDLNDRSHSEQVYDTNKTLLIDDFDYNKIMNEQNCLLIPSWDITQAKTPADVSYCLRDMELIKILRYISYVSDCVIHKNKTVPEILSK
jgi:TFIIF-interacting CTD phosphatase-like protein